MDRSRKEVPTVANLPENEADEKSNLTSPEGGPVVIVAGPTASGKSALALDVAEAFGGEIVNADSMQVYADLRILSARPGSADLARVPHHLYGVLDAADQGSAGWWLERAVETIEGIWSRAKLPVVCGGTGLYLKVLTEGIAPVPLVPDNLVAEARTLYERLGGEGFRRELTRLDAAAANRLNAADRQRLVRAYAVAAATGRTLDQWHGDQAPGPALQARFFAILLDPPRDTLYEAIEGRFRRMVAEGAVDEVRTLLSALQARAVEGRPLDPGLPVLKALGVPEIRRHLETGEDLETVVAAAEKATRNFAKRQVTWFRHQMSPDLVVGRFGAGALGEVGPAVAAFLAGDAGGG